MDAPAAAPRVVAVVSDYLSLIAAFRTRVAELGINYETLDALAGWTDTYSTKLLAEEPLKTFGPLSFDAMTGATAVQFLMVENPTQLERIKRRRDFVPRKYRRQNRVHAVGKHGYVVRRITRENNRQIAHLGGIARAEKLSKTKRHQIARKAAKARWSTPRLEELK
jgi:hypothetical protein